MPRVPAAGTPRPRLPDGPPGGPHRHVGPYWLWHRQQRHDGACYDKTPADGAQPSERVRCVALVRNTDGHDAGQHHTEAGLLPPVQCAGVLRRGRGDQRRSESQDRDKPPYPHGAPPSQATEYTSTVAAFLGMVSHELRAPLTSIKGSPPPCWGLGSVDRHGLHVLCSHAHDVQEGGELVTASCCPDVRRPACRRDPRARRRPGRQDRRSPWAGAGRDGGRDQRRAPADRGDGRRAGGGRESGSCPPATAAAAALAPEESTISLSSPSDSKLSPPRARRTPRRGRRGSRHAYGGPDDRPRRTPAPAGPPGGDAPSAPATALCRLLLGRGRRTRRGRSGSRHPLSPVDGWDCGSRRRPEPPTPAESQVAAWLADGKSVRDMATATELTEGAIYWHLK